MTEQIGYISRVVPTVPDIEGVTLGLIENVNNLFGIVTLRGLEAGPGIQLNLVNTGYADTERAIVISATGTSTSFLDLTDVPHSYAGAANYVLKVNPSGTGIIFSPSGGGGGNTNYIVPNIASRNALTPNPGDNSFVQDTGAGKWGYYIWTGASWTLLVNQDASTVDAHTISIYVNYNTSSPPTGIEIGTLTPLTRVVLVSITITTPWNDSSATMTIGDNGDNGGGPVTNRLVTAAQNDLTVSGGVYELEPVYQYIGYNAASSATVGAAGIGYNIGDILTVVGGVGVAATFTVATLTGGAGSGVATVTLLSGGNYSSVPSNPANTTDSGVGTGATLDLTTSSALEIPINVYLSSGGSTQGQALVTISYV
jgi:hypothetical protein